MSVKTIDLLESMFLKSLEEAGEMFETRSAGGYGCARIHLEYAHRFLDLVNAVRDDGDPVEGGGKSANIVTLFSSEAAE